VGSADEFYFSRLFNGSTGCSPQFYREYETEIRGGKNLLPVDKMKSNSESTT
jgi:AraC-like DNA-binding protein